MTLRRLLLPFTFAVAACIAALVSAPSAPAQPGVVPIDESFESPDGVKLNGRFYRATASKNNSCVLLLPGYKKDPTKGHWDDLAKLLAKEGYNALLLHYRGHGKSTDVSGRDFYSNPYIGPFNTRWVPGANRNPPRSTIQMADLRPQYLPVLANDIMAARAHLERKNDAGEVNISTLYLIGADEACALGLLYITAEWHREAVQPNVAVPPAFIAPRRVLIPPNADTAGKDIAACIWLSPDRPPSLQDGTVKGFVSRFAPEMRTETRMLFLHAENDRQGQDRSRYFHDEVLVAKGRGNLPKMDLTEIRPIKNAKQLTGVDLLGNNPTFGTEDLILKYLRAIDDDRRGKARFTRNYTKPLPIALQAFGINP
jgi:hypothetical protein